MNSAAGVDVSLCRTLQPDWLVSEASRPLPRFLTSYGDSPLLLIKVVAGLEGLEGALTAIKSGAEQRVQPSVRAMGFETQVMSDNQRRAPDADSSKKQEWLRVDRVRWSLRTDRYFVLPLRKRSNDTTFADRISVGRATNKDVVLRHSSVSKFHAWFEVDDQGETLVADADSTNPTQLNGRKLGVRELTRVQSGDQVRFGSIECLLCSASDFWHAVRASEGS